jgi:phytanoyl-CoA hydroxylase
MAGSLSQQQVWFFRHNGYLLVKGCLPKMRALSLQQLISELFTAPKEPFERSKSGRVVRLSNLASRDPLIWEESRSPAILDPLQSLLGPNIEFLRNRHNHASIGIEKTYRSRLHRDVLQWSRNLVSVLIYLDDCDEAVSATKVIPASHLLPLIDIPNNGGTWMDEHSVYKDVLHQALPVLTSTGDVLLMDGLIFHAAGIAPSGQNLRRIVTLAYTAVDELLDVENVDSRIVVRGERIYRGGLFV